MGRLYRREKGGVIYGDYYTPEGKRVQRSLRTHDRTVAKERLRLAELAATPQARGRKQRLSEAIDHMIALQRNDKAAGTISMYEEKGRRIFMTFGDPLVGDISHDTISEYIAKRLDPDNKAHGRASRHTIAKELITIRRALKVANQRGILPHLPTFPEFSAKYQPRETWLEPEQFELVAAELDEKRRRWSSLAALAGANLSEVEAIDWAKVQFSPLPEFTGDPDAPGWAEGGNPGRLFIPGTKRETRRRWVPMAPALRNVLERVPASERRGFVAERWGNVRRDLHRAVDAANRRAAELAKKEGREAPTPIPYVSPNDLRRTFASWLVQKGVPLLTVAALMGHSSTRMVERVYGKLSKKNFDEAIAALPDLKLLPSPPKKEPED
jgi:integrase